jgi:hypothetical protein
MTNPNARANSWSAHFAKLAAIDKDDNSLPAKYALVLPPSTLASTCYENLVSVPNCVALLITPLVRVRLIHHFHWDKRTPVYTSGTDEIWGLLGTSDSPPVVTFDHLNLAKTVQNVPIPSWETLRDAPDAAAFCAQSVDTDASTAKLSCKAVLSLPPSLAYHLFGSSLDDPAKLGVILARAINTADTYFTTKGLPPAGAPALQGPPTLTPVATAYYEACAFLWLASQPSFTTTVALEILPVGPPATWAQGIRDKCILPTIPSPGPGLGPTTQATENLVEVCGLLRDSILASTAQRTHNKDSKGFKKLLPTHTQTMILRAFEPTTEG